MYFDSGCPLWITNSKDETLNLNRASVEVLVFLPFRVEVSTGQSFS